MTDITVSPRRIQVTRHKPWRPGHPNAVGVARPSKWGNPFKVGEPAFGPGSEPVRDRAHAVELYALHTGPMGNYELDIDEVRRELGGRDLACWCPLVDGKGQPVPCHADVLLEIANDPARLLKEDAHDRHHHG